MSNSDRGAFRKFPDVAAALQNEGRGLFSELIVTVL